MKACVILTSLLFGMVVGMAGAATPGNGDTNGGGDIFAAALGWGDTVLGERAGASNTTGNYNVFLGFEAGRDNVKGEGNTFCGFQAGMLNLIGGHNVFCGFQTGDKNLTGSNNTCLGDSAGYSNETGSGNVFIGNRAGYYENRSNKLWIANADNNCLIFGDFATGTVGIGTSTPYDWDGARLHAQTNAKDGKAVYGTALSSTAGGTPYGGYFVADGPGPDAKSPHTGIGIYAKGPTYAGLFDGYVKATGYFTGDLFFQKDGQTLWRMFEDQAGLYVENVASGKKYDVVLRESGSVQPADRDTVVAELKQKVADLEAKLEALAKKLP